MNATLTAYRAKHRGRWSPTDYLGAPDHTARHAHAYCRRCAESDTTAPAKCQPCRAEVQRVRDEMRAEIEAAALTMAWLNDGMDDAGRIDVGRWGA